MKNSQLKPFRTTEFVFWTTLLGVVASIIGYVYFFNMISAVGQNTSVLLADTNALAAKESQVGQLKKNLAANQAQEPVLLSYFVDANDIIPFLETIEGYGRSTNVTVKFNTVEIKQSPDQLAVAFKADGSFIDLYRFLALVEAAPYEFSITNANVQLGASLADATTKSKVPVASIWEADISLSVVSINGIPKAAPVIPTTSTAQ